MSVLAVPAALDLLRAQLKTPAAPQDIGLPLRALQLRGLSKLDLIVHVERIRAANDATNASGQLEEQCLLALDIIHGTLPTLGLTWDAQHEAASLLPRCVDRDLIRRAVVFALEPSDLIPPRPIPSDTDAELPGRLGDTVFDAISAYALLPERADLIRAPKGTFTTRPAALLRFFDRVALEALTEIVDASLDAVLPDEVVWPRHRSHTPSSMVNEVVLSWESAYVVKADITNFYASVEHAQLAVFLNSHLSVGLLQARAIEAMLSSTMGGPRGLPQGPQCSDTLASAYLQPIDRHLADGETPYLRFADDYYFPADTMGEGRRLLQLLEALLEDIGLSLNQEKTYIMRHSTYEGGIGGAGPAVRELKKELMERRLQALDDVDAAADAEGILERIGIPEQTTWDLLYHHTVDVEDVVTELVEAVGPDYGELYGTFFKGVARQLRGGDRGGEFSAWAYLAQESLLFLARSEVNVSPDDLRLVQTWFPETTPRIVRYLTAGGRRDEKWVRDFLAGHLREPSAIDWVDAWMCHASALVPALGRGAAAQLRRLLNRHAAGPLTKAEAVRALAAHGRLRENEWRRSLERASPAISAEMLFVALALRDLYPWLEPDLAKWRDTPAWWVARSLEAGE